MADFWGKGSGGRMALLQKALSVPFRRVIPPSVVWTLPCNATIMKFVLECAKHVTKPQTLAQR